MASGFSDLYGTYSVTADTLQVQNAVIVNATIGTLNALDNQNITSNNNIVIPTPSKLIGNVSGNVTGAVLGDVTGNVTGNVVGNVVGNVTGTASYATTANYANILTTPLSGDIIGLTNMTVIKDGSVTTTNSILDNSIINSKILDGTIQNSKLATASVLNNANTIVLRDANGATNLSRLVTNIGIGNAHHTLLTNGIDRWSFTLIGAETGVNNVGSNFGLYRYNDAGAITGTPLQVERNTGRIIHDAETLLYGNISLQRKSGTDYRNIAINGGNSTGYIYANYQGLGDGIHMGYNFYYQPNDTSSPLPYIPNSSNGTSRISTKYGRIELATGSVNTVPTEYMRIENGQITAMNGARFNGSFLGDNVRITSRWEITNDGDFLKFNRYNDSGVFHGTSMSISYLDNKVNMYNGLSMGNGQDIENVNTIFTGVLSFRDSNASINAPGNITFINEGAIDFYFRNLINAKSLSIVGYEFPLPLTVRSDNMNNGIGVSIGRVNNELELNVNSTGNSSIISTGSLSINASEIIFNNTITVSGIKVGGSSNTLDNYTVQSITTTWSGPWGSTTYPRQITFVRVGHTCTMRITANTGTTVSSSTDMISSEPIPSAFRPINDGNHVNLPCILTTGSSNIMGFINIWPTTGVFYISPLTPVTSGTLGWRSIYVNYLCSAFL